MRAARWRELALRPRGHQLPPSALGSLSCSHHMQLPGALGSWFAGLCLYANPRGVFFSFKERDTALLRNSRSQIVTRTCPARLWRVVGRVPLDEHGRECACTRWQSHFAYTCAFSLTLPCLQSAQARPFSRIVSTLALASAWALDSRTVHEPCC